MNGDDHEIERSLRADAERLLTCHNAPTADELLARHRDRTRRRRLSGGVTLLLAVAIGLSLLQTRIPFHVDPIVANDPPSEVREPVSSVEDKPPNPIPQLSSSELLDAESGAVPVLLVRRKPDGTDVVMPGIYVPKSEPVSVDRLAPVERRAIRQVLGIRKPLVPKQSI